MLFVLIADDHEVVRLGMRLLLAEAIGQSHIDFAESCPEVMTKIRQQKYDLLITDINMPGNEGLNTIETILAVSPGIKTLVISVLPENMYGPGYLRSGAYGYLEKGASNDSIKKAIKSIVLGKKYFSHDLLLRMANKGSQPTNLFEGLSERELEVIKLLINGKAIGEAAVVLGMHISTTSTYKVRAFKKLGVQNIRELIDLAKLNGLA